MSGRDPAEALRATARVLDAAAAVSATDWDACAGGGNPFLSHAFFVALEESGSAAARAGWQPVHLVIDDPEGRPSAIARSEEHTSELQSLMRISYAASCLHKHNTQPIYTLHCHTNRPPPATPDTH